MSEKESINNKMERLKAEVDWFSGEDFDLGQAADKYKAAVKLAEEVQGDLAKLKNEIEVISKDFNS